MPEQNTNHTVHYSNESAKKITCDAIETAFINLLEDNEFEKITISDLVKRAGVSRTAFYRNYDSKEVVLNNLLHGVFDEVSDSLNRDAFYRTPEVFWRRLLLIVRKHLHPFQLLLKAGLGNTILEEITLNTINVSHAETVGDYYNEVFWSGAVYNVLIHWVRGGAEIPVDEMVDICLRIRENA